MVEEEHGVIMSSSFGRVKVVVWFRSCCGNPL